MCERPYEVNSEEKAQRLACPNGHRDIGPTNHHWLCNSCARSSWGCDAEYEFIIDRKTGAEYRRDEVKFDDTVVGANYV